MLFQRKPKVLVEWVHHRIGLRVVLRGKKLVAQYEAGNALGDIAARYGTGVKGANKWAD